MGPCLYACPSTRPYSCAYTCPYTCNIHMCTHYTHMPTCVHMTRMPTCVHMSIQDTRTHTLGVYNRRCTCACTFLYGIHVSMLYPCETKHVSMSTRGCAVYILFYMAHRHHRCQHVGVLLLPARRVHHARLDHLRTMFIHLSAHMYVHMV